MSGCRVAGQAGAGAGLWCSKWTQYGSHVDEAPCTQQVLSRGSREWEHCSGADKGAQGVGSVIQAGLRRRVGVSSGRQHGEIFPVRSGLSQSA